MENKTPLEIEIEEMLKQETPESEDNVIEEEPKAQEEPKEEPAQEEAKEEEPKQEAKPEPDHAAIARANYEAREAKRRAAELEAELEKLKNPPKQIPDRAENWEGHIEARAETLEQRLERLEKERQAENAQREHEAQINAAKQEFNDYEESFKPNAPDYEDARAFYVQSVARSVKILNPNISQAELVKSVEINLLMRGAQAVNSGLNPAQSIYTEAKNLGYQKKEPEAKQTSLKIISENKKKSAGTAGGSSSIAGKKSFLDMTTAERAKLSQSDWDAMEA